MKILVIDDMECIRGLVKTILEQNHEVATAPDGEKGLKLFLQDNFDLVITDRQMPGMSGEEVVRKIKLSRPDIKVILMTAATPEEEEEIRPVAIAAGADCIMNKDRFFYMEKVIQELFL